MRLYIIIIGVCSLFLGACHIYSFTGASIPPEAKTVSVKYFPNQASIVKPTLSQSFTEKLRDKITSQTSLILVERAGDLQFEGRIVDYSVAPTAIQSNETAALNRLTITVEVKYENKFDEKQNFDTRFARYADYESSQSLSAVEDQLLEQINEALVDDIFNKALVNW
ncbi:MAG: hypothetical protein KKA07_01330 [Bacteroidetes bacterium]|nr:hypothetical protein [Bacteroidota bacterium]MBU1717691.1 hypothetical protein [Bacteroidota bacterium]